MPIMAEKSQDRQRPQVTTLHIPGIKKRRFPMGSGVHIHDT
jgi:hypothetical protein